MFGRKLLGSIINFGVAFLIFLVAVSRVFLGYLPASRRGHAAITVANNPGAFWITIALLCCVSFVFVLFGVFSFVSAMKSR